MADLITDLSTYLIGKNLASGMGIDIFADSAPDTPISNITIYEYQGFPAPLQEPNILHRSLQVTIRGDKAQVSKKKAWDIFKALQSNDRFVQLSSERFAQIYLRQAPFKMYVDKQQRIVYGFNMGVTTKHD